MTPRTREQTGVIKPRPWTTDELKRLRELAIAGAGVVGISEALGRSAGAVRLQASRQRLSLRRAGERRGSILGELPDRRLPRELRLAVLIGFVDQHTAAARGAARGDLCPACALRSISTRSGYCGPCHLRMLADGHREEIATGAGRLELDAARALKYRSRRQTR